MLVVGLTGSIGMGKSTTARMFAARGVPVHDADAAVHALYRGAAVGPVREVFPDAIVDGVVDRAALSRLVLGDADALARLESIVHPLVQAAELDFLALAADAGARVAVVEVPLLLETGGEARVDAVVVVTAPGEVQRARVLSRPGMDDARLAAILARQMPDEEKCRRAHFLVDTGAGLAAAEKQVDDILRALAAVPGAAYHRRRADGWTDR